MLVQTFVLDLISVDREFQSFEAEIRNDLLPPSVSRL